MICHRPTLAWQILALAGLAFCFASPAPAQDEPKAGEREPADIVRKRWEWFYNQRAYPLERIPPGARLRALHELDQMMASEREARARRAATDYFTPAAESSTTWTSIGPQPINVDPSLLGGGTPTASGRVTALVVDPTNKNVVYLGAAEGGVWKTTDGGTTWTPLTDTQTSLAVGSIAIDPSSCGSPPCRTIYVGTGEENFNGDSYYGEGILKSTNGGSTWTLIPGPFAGPISPDSYYGGGARIGSLAVHPTNGLIILAGVLGGSGGDGIYRSADAGLTWTNVMPLGTCTGVLFNPSSGNTAYAAIKGLGVYVSSDAGLTWTADNGTGSNTLPTTSTGAIELAIDPAHPQTLYAGVSHQPDHSLQGLYKTSDGGLDWIPVTGIPDYCTPQCDYDDVVRVDPADSNTIYVGGSAGTKNVHNFYRSTDGGNTWTEISQGANSVNLHVDHHAIAFSQDGSVVYDGNDGGVWSTSNVSTSPVAWTDLNAALAITQFYPGISIDPTIPTATRTFGGTQDNGTDVYAGALAWTEVDTCGDGTYTAIDPSTPNTVYVACIQGENVFKSTTGGGFGTWTQIDTSGSGLNTSERSGFVQPMVIDPSNPHTLYFGTFRVYQTTNAGSNWAPISGDLTSGGALGNVTSIAVAPSNSNTVYAGTSDSHVQVTTNPGAGPSGWNNVSTGLPPRAVTQVAVDPVHSTTAYVTFSGFSGFLGDTLGHVFKTTTGGSSWTDISGTGVGGLPNVPVNDIVVDPNLPNTLYIATDIGVFSTSDGGTTWSTLMTGLPRVAVLSLKLHSPSRTLRAASHGRGVWDLVVPIASSITIAPSSLTFPTQAIGTTSAAQTVTLTNNGTGALTITSISASGDFAAPASGNTCGASLAAGANCTVQVTFTPTAPGTRGGSLTFVDTDPTSPQSVALSGTGSGGTSVSVSSSSVSFGNQAIGTPSASQAVTLTNTGSGSLTITSFSISGVNAGDFTQTNTCGSSVAAGGTCTINVTFTPTGPGSRTAVLMIADNATGSPQTVTLTGTGTGPFVSFSPNSLAFVGQVITTASAAQTITLSNTGSGLLTFSTSPALTITGANASDFAQTTNCGATNLGSNSSCTISVVFTPAAAGSRTATLSVADNAFGSPQTVALTGTGTDFSIAAASGSQTTATVTAGATATYVLAFTGTTGFAGSVSLACSGAPLHSTCSIAPTSLSLSGTTASTATVSEVTIARTLVGPRSSPLATPPALPIPWRLSPGRWLLLFSLLLGLTGLAWDALKQRRALGRAVAIHNHARWRWRFAMAVLFVAMLGAMLMAGCGGGGSSQPVGTNGTLPGTYTLTVTATVTSGTTTLTHNIALTLKVN